MGEDTHLVNRKHYRQTSELYRGLLGPIDFNRFITAFQYTPTEFISFILNRSDQQPDFSRDEHQWVEAFSREALTATRMAIRLQELDRTLNGVIESYASLGLGAILIKHGRVSDMNALAADIVATRRFLTVSANRLTTVTGLSSEPLGTAMTRAALLLEPHQTVELLTRESTGVTQALRVEIISPDGWTRGFRAMGRGHRPILVLLRSQQQQSEHLAGRLRKAGLTPLEVELATGLHRGITLSEIAASRDRRISTIRSQLKSVFRKLAVNSQVQLLRHLGHLSARQKH